MEILIIDDVPANADLLAGQLVACGDLLYRYRENGIGVFTEKEFFQSIDILRDALSRVKISNLKVIICDWDLNSGLTANDAMDILNKRLPENQPVKTLIVSSKPREARAGIANPDITVIDRTQLDARCLKNILSTAYGRPDLMAMPG